MNETNSVKIVSSANSSFKAKLSEKENPVFSNTKMPSANKHDEFIKKRMSTGTKTAIGTSVLAVAGLSILAIIKGKGGKVINDAQKTIAKGTESLKNGAKNAKKAVDNLDQNTMDIIGDMAIIFI